MQNQIQKFYNTEFGSLDIILVDGTPYFPATDCAKVLGYKNPRDAIHKHCKQDGVIKRNGVSVTTNQHGVATNQMVVKTYISEGNLYRLIVRSKLPGAKRFERWVFDEAIPSIRSYGAVITLDMLDEMLRDPESIDILLEALRKERLS